MTPNTLRATRESLDLTQGQLAKAIGCSREHVTRMETGARQISTTIALAVEGLKALTHK